MLFMKNFEKLRIEYCAEPLLEKDLSSSPFKQFEWWLEEAIRAKVMEPHACTLSTVSKKQPYSRMVLLKDFSFKGFLFFSNATSQKGKQIDKNAYVSLCFWWKEIYRQVVVQGKVEKSSSRICKKYFYQRPNKAQIAFLSSKQSEEVSREALHETYRKLCCTLKNKKVPYPKQWQGYLVVPHQFEFWQGHEHRLHDRAVYEKKRRQWRIKRLAP